MHLKIERVRPALAQEWDSAWAECAYATYFHSRDWAELWRDYTKGLYIPAPLIVEFSDGKAALLPLSCEASEGSVRGFVSSPPDVYGGWIAVNPIGREHAALLREFLTTQLGKLDWQINPFDDLLSAVPPKTQERVETHAINLKNGFETNYREWSSACRRAERKAQRSGVAVRLAQTEDDWHDYFLAYEDSCRRWGDRALSKYEWRLFELMHGIGSKHLRLWLATAEGGRIVGGALIGYAKRHAVYWHGAVLEDSLALRPMNLLFYEVIADACRQGYEWFDFNSSAGLDGVRRFKEGFGARPMDCSIVHVRGAPLATEVADAQA
jgi:hypothetical protein